MFLSDFHCHSELSFDGKSSLLEMVRQADHKGISEICITDHYECAGDFIKHNTPILQMRQNYLKTVAANKTPVKLRFGIEIGEPTQNLGITEPAIADGKFDFIIASVHNVEGHPDFYDIDYRTANIDELADLYYKELTDVCRWGKFDVFGHINYFERYVAKAGLAIDLTKYFEPLRALFKLIVHSGKGIELNTAGLFAPVGKTQPDLAALKLYKECGGEIVTTGSDSHLASNIGQGIECAVELLKEAGFQYVTVFESRTPKFIKID